MAALVVFVKRVALGRAEGGEVVAAEYARFEASRGEEAEDTVEVIEE